MREYFSDTVKINDAHLFVKQYGQADRDLLFIHGGPDWDHSYFLPFAAPLSEKFRLTFFDLRGCGRSTKFNDSSKYSLELAADDVGALIEKLKLKDVFILGFSFGGRVLMELLSKEFSQIRAAIFASTTAYTNYQEELNGWDEYNIRHNIQIRNAVEKLFSDTSISDEEKSKKLAFLTADLDIWDLRNAKNYKSILNKINFSGEWMKAWKSGALNTTPKNYEGILKDLKIPILVLHGEKDMRFPIGTAKRLHKSLPESKLKIIKNAGHMTHIEQSKLWMDSVTDFLLKI